MTRWPASRKDEETNQSEIEELHDDTDDPGRSAPSFISDSLTER